MHLSHGQRQHRARLEPVFGNVSNLRRKRRYRRLLLVGSLILILSTVGIVYFHQSILRSLASPLVYQSHPRHSDLVVVLSGGGSPRMEKAIELHQAGYADTIQMTLPEQIPPEAPARDGLEREVRLYKALLDLRQVAPARVQWSSSPYYSTYDEAVFLKERMAERNWHSAIVVPGYFQSRRAKWTFRHAFDDSHSRILVIPAPSEIYSTTDWWTHEEGFITIENEWMKNIYYQLKGLVGKP